MLVTEFKLSTLWFSWSDAGEEPHSKTKIQGVLYFKKSFLRDSKPMSTWNETAQIFYGSNMFSIRTFLESFLSRSTGALRASSLEPAGQLDL